MARAWRVFLLLTTGLLASSAQAQSTYFHFLSGTNLGTAPTASPTAVTFVPITNVNANETLVGIDVRPQNQQLYGLGVNATANTATLYCISAKTGFANPVGSGGFFFTTDGATEVDLPDPAVVGYGFDFNPAADRVRVVAGSLNFRVDPNTGLGADGNNGGGVVAGTNPDGPVNTGTTTVDATAYTNAQPNNGGITTQYTLDAASNSLYIQNAPNSGTQTLGQTVTLGGNPLDFTSISGFDIPAGVNAAASNAAVTTGSAFAVLNVGGTTGLYSINLVNGQATLIGNVGNGATAVQGMTIRQELSAAIALNAAGDSLLRFSPATPGTVTTQAINLTNLVAGEQLVGMDFRPQTGQFYALGINHNSETGTLYLLDPQSGVLTVAVGGTSSAITFAGVNFPDPATGGYGMDFNPTVDRIRVVTSAGQNFRVNPITGLPATATLDGNIGGLPGGSTGVSATAYTNSYTQLLTGGVTTQYTLDAASNSLFIQNPPNNGTQTSQLAVTLSGAPLDFTDVNGFDIPGAVQVATSNTAASGEGYFVATVGGTTGVYQINLATGAATSLGAVGAGATPLQGLTVFATPSLTVRDSASTVIYTGQKTIDFGDVTSGNVVTDTVTVANNGTQTLTYTATVPASRYAITQNATGVVAAGASATITITYTATTAGTDNRTLTIATNDAANNTFTIALTGETVPVLVSNDKVTVTATGGATLIYPLANDGLDTSFEITAVSNGAITIGADGRSLLIPAGFPAGTFTYTATDGTTIAQGTIEVVAGVSVAAPTTYSGLLFAANGDIVGSATASISTKNIATVQLLGGSAKVSTKITLGAAPSTGANFTTLGYVELDRNVDGTLTLALEALGGDITGTLVAVVKTAVAAKHHIALAATDPAVPGGGYAIATVSTKGAVKITGLLPDGVAFSATSALRENDTFVFHTSVKGPKPPAVLGGQLTVGDLTATDVTGELAWVKRTQLAGVKGLHLTGVDTTLLANGSLYTGLAPLPTGAGTLSLSGGNLALNEVNPVVVSAAGIPAPAVASALKTWTGVKVKVGKFSATVAVPTITKPVKGSGLYLPKTNSAWGYFPGTTVGGRIELTVP